MRDTDPVKPDREPVTVGGFAGLADRHYDAAPVGVLAGNGGLHQRRVGDGKRDSACRTLRHRALDHDLNELARALAVAGHLLGEIGEHGVKALAQRRQPRIGHGRDLRRAAGGGGTGREREQRVGSRSVAVDCHRVEGIGNTVLEQVSQDAGGDRRVGEHETQHSCEIGPDHAGTFGNAADGDGGRAEPHDRRSGLGKRVRGHDRFGRLLPRAGRRARDELTDNSAELRGV